MEEYLEKLKNEYLNSTNDKNLINFNNWLDEKKIHLNRYLEILKYLGLYDTHMTMELDRGRYDTIALTNNFKYLFEISNYASTIEENILLVDGKFEVKNGKKIVTYPNKNKVYFNSNLVDNYISYLDVNDSSIFDLATSNSTVYYGFYAKITDLDILNKIEYMNEVKTKLKYLRYLLASLETEINDTYVNILKINKNYIKI